jgi:hypothetical protein
MPSFFSLRAGIVVTGVAIAAASVGAVGCSANSTHAASGTGAATGGTSGSGGHGGAPSCGGGQLACSGTCIPVDSDPNNCGACGNVCGSGAKCCSGACVTTASCAFAVTQVDPPSGWQNGGGYVKLLGAGFVKGARVSIGDGKAPARVIDAGTILIETPPGPVGAEDVTVSLGGMTATLPGGFTYKQGGLDQTWQQKKLTTGRAVGPGLAVMQDGRVLIAGGLSGLTWDTALDTADVYTVPDPAAVAVPSKMVTPRFIARAVTLLGGKVVVVGGACHYSTATGGCLGNPAAIDLFDPAAGSFAPSAASFPGDVVAVQGVLLPDGRVFFNSNTSPNAAIYDPDADALKSVALPIPGPYGLGYAFVVRLRDGRVLIGAGDLAGTSMPASYTFLFDPATDTIAPTGPFVNLRSGATANTLPDGRVLVVGGSDPNNAYLAVDTIELYDPAAGKFSLAPYKLSVVRDGHATVLVRDGTVLAVGGSNGGIKDCTTPGEWTATVDQIDPVAAKVTPFPPLAQPVEGISGVVTLDGSVFVGGGAQCGVAPVPYVDFLQSTVQ